MSGGLTDEDEAINKRAVGGAGEEGLEDESGCAGED